MIAVFAFFLIVMSALLLVVVGVSIWFVLLEPLYRKCKAWRRRKQVLKRVWQ